MGNVATNPVVPCRRRPTGQRRRHLLLVALGVAAIPLGTLFLNRGQLQPGPQKNLLLITLDTTRADHLGCYGYRHADTPTIDALCRDGVRYDRCYAPAPMTLPSHTSILTGLHPPRHGVRINGQPSLSPSFQTLAEIVAAEGYATAAVVGAFVLDRQFGLAQGFAYYDDDLSRGRDGGRFRFSERTAQEVTDAAVAWLSRPRDAPFFLWVHYFDAHDPYAPPGFRPQYSGRIAYDAEITYVDQQLSRFLGTLERIEAGRETIVVVTADHGEALGEHGEFTHGLFAYEGTLRVPLIVYFSRGSRVSGVVSTPVALVDVMPSVLAWLDLRVPDGLDGRILPLTDATPEAGRNEESRAIYFENLWPAHQYGWSALAGIVVQDDKYIRAPRPELYHLSADPYEERNLFASATDRATRMSQRLARLETEWSDVRVPQSPPREIDDTALARLALLGYVAHAGSSALSPRWSTPGGRDPKDMVEVHQRILTAIGLLEKERQSQAVDVLLDVVATHDPMNRRAILMLADVVPTAVGDRRSRIVGYLKAAVRRGLEPDLDRFVRLRCCQALLREGRHSQAGDLCDATMK